MNRPIKGCGGADKLQCGLAGVARLLASTSILGFLQLKPGSAGRAPGIPDVLGWNLWWHLSTGISAYGDIHPSVWHDGTCSVVPASYLPTHICLSERCWKLCFLLSRTRKGRVCAENRELLCYLETWKVTPTADANVMSIGFSLRVAKTPFFKKMSLKWKVFFFKHGSKGIMEIRTALKNLRHLLLIYSNVNLDWGCIKECLLQNIQRKIILKGML